ncbi:MAG: mraZ [Opitutaceae bacterium]|nr:mraZ [Opitutaceae bacterium]
MKTIYTRLFRHSLDEKNRLTIPSEWRWAHGEEEAFLATPHPDGYVAVLPPDEVEKLRAKISAMALTDREAQDVAARFFSGTSAVWFDKQGRILLTPELLAHAGIRSDAVLVGSGNMFKIYSPSRWAKVERRTAGEGLGEAMRRLGI